MLVTVEFREALKKWVKEKVGRQTELAKAIGCHPSNISQMLNRPDEYQTSELVLPISQYTGIPLPDIAAKHAPAYLPCRSAGQPSFERWRTSFAPST